MTVSALQQSGWGLRFIHDVTCALAPLLPVIYRQQQLNLESLIRLLWFDTDLRHFFILKSNFSFPNPIQLPQNSSPQGDQCIITCLTCVSSLNSSHFVFIRCCHFAGSMQTCSTSLLMSWNQYKRIVISFLLRSLLGKHVFCHIKRKKSFVYGQFCFSSFFMTKFKKMCELLTCFFLSNSPRKIPFLPAL
jgi:hypothetical protein